MPRKPRGRAVAAAPTYELEFLGRLIPVRDMREASRIVSAVRDRSGAGASEMGSEFLIRENGRVVGYVSYNGRVWEGPPDYSMTKPDKLAYDPNWDRPKEDIPPRPPRRETRPEGPLEHVATVYADRLDRNLDDYMKGLAAHADYQGMMTRIWNEVRERGVELDEAVMEILRARRRA